MSISADETVHYDVIVIGAGVVGPAVATGFARQGRRVLLVEREWSQPDRIVGELLQPAGLKALKALGMTEAIQGIEAIPVKGYAIFYKNKELLIDYPQKNANFRVGNVPHCVNSDNARICDDTTFSRATFEESSQELGVAFRHGEFISNLRKIALNEPNITCLKGTVTRLERDSLDTVVGVRVSETERSNVVYKSDLTVCCDGIFSKFRKTLGKDNVSSVGSYFISLTLTDAEMPHMNRGHVVISDKDPILVYQISPEETRILCAYRSAKLPSVNDATVQEYLHEHVYRVLPDCLKPSYKNALKDSRIRIMPNSYLIAKKNDIPGLLVLGDALNMRHPLTGGGMTVGLNDAALICKMLAPENVPNLAEHGEVLEKLNLFHYERKNLGSVINVLSIALYSLFSANTRYLQILQEGCFCYLNRIPYPIALLSGLVPEPFVLFKHFFAVAFYSIVNNFFVNGLAMFPISIYESILTLYTAIVVFTPYMWNELVS